MFKSSRIETLKVKESRSFGSGKNKTRLVVFPDHEFTVEHFHPANFQIESAAGASHRAKIVQSLGGQKFVVRTRRESSRNLPTLNLVSEARLARYLSGLSIPNVQIDQPLAAIMAPGKTCIFYRYVERIYTEGHPLELSARAAIFEKLSKLGIESADALQTRLTIDGKVHLFDLEHMKVPENLRRKLRLKYLK